MLQRYVHWVFRTQVFGRQTPPPAGLEDATSKPFDHIARISGSVMSSTDSTKQETTGSRLAQMIDHAKILLEKSTYVSGFKNGIITAISVVCIIALYWVMIFVWIRNSIRSYKGRKAPKAATPKPSPVDVEPIIRPAGDIGLNMDEVQEIPGEGELATKEAMPARDQIPEIEDEPQAGSSDEREPVHTTFDDNTTTTSQDDLAGAKTIPTIVPVIKHDFERPISPPATPPTEAADLKASAVDPVESFHADSTTEVPTVVDLMNVTSNESFAPRELPTRSDTEKTRSTVEEAAKAVEDHAKFVEDATSPTESTVESTVELSIESSKTEIDSPTSEFVVVSDAEDKPVENVPQAPVENSYKAVEETGTNPPVPIEPATTKISVAGVPATTQSVVEPQQPVIVADGAKPEAPAPLVEDQPAEEPKPVEEPKAVIEEPKVEDRDSTESTKVAEDTQIVEKVKATEEPKATGGPKVFEEPRVVEEPKIIEESVVEKPKVVEEPETIEEPEASEEPESEGSSKAAFPSISKTPREEPVAPLSPKSLRPRVMRRATGSTSAVAGVTTSPAPATVAVVSPVDDKANIRAQASLRAENALNRLAGSLLRSNNSERSPVSPVSGIPRPTSPISRPTSPLGISRAASPNVFRSESPLSDTGANSRPTSPTFGMPRRGSIVAPRPVSRQSTLANVNNGSERSSSPARKSTFINPPRGGATSPPPMPLPPSRQGSQGTVSPQYQGSVRGSHSPQVPQAAVMSPSVLSRKATIDSNGSPGSPPNGRRAASPPPTRIASPPPTRALAEELTIDQATRRNTSFPPTVEGPQIASPTGVKPRPRPRTSTSGSAKAAMAPNTLLSTLTSKVTFPGGTNPISPSDSSPASPNPASPASPVSPASPASPNRSDSFASAVSNRNSIYSFSDMSDMDMSTSDLDFAGRESHRMVLGRLDSMGSMGSIASSDDGMSGNEEDRQKKRAKRRAKARAQALKKQKRSKRN
ncbi:hypothetical protein RHS03_05700, partial [Rhizoctonia solani]